ncbi:MAG: hypothetical protein H5T73_03135 [Actinobacteria bacterium]|nr:hypothetical protein [Actinomycetota bacterium]
MVRRRRAISILVAVFLLFTFTFTVFSYTLEARRPWFGKLSPGHHQWLTGSTVKFAKNWWREGALKLKFTMFENPASAEFPTLESRDAYISYPPGTIIPIYIAAKLAGREPGPSLVMSYNLLNHFLIALFLGLIVLVVLLDAGFGVPCSFVFALIPITLELLMPAPLYWHQNVFFSDQAVILPIVLFLFCEALRDSSPGEKVFLKGCARRSVNALQVLVFFYGVLTDWLFLFIAAAVFIKRVFCGEYGKRVKGLLARTAVFWLPAAAAMSVFALQLSFFHYDIVGKFLFRSGISTEGSSYAAGFFRTFWNGHVAEGYGRPAVYLLWFSCGVCVLLLMRSLYGYFSKKGDDERNRKIMYMAAVFTLPFFVQVYAFRNHATIHDFSALKFSLTLAVVPFVLLPCALLLYLEKVIRARGRKSKETGGRRSGRWSEESPAQPLQILAAVTLLVVVAVYAGLEFPRHREFFPEPGDYATEMFVAKNTGYYDVVFSTEFEIPDNPPQQLSYAMKRVYRVASLSEIYEKVSGIEGDYLVDVLSFDGAREEEGGIGGLLELATTVIRENGRFLYRVDKPTFLEYCTRREKEDAESVLRREKSPAGALGEEVWPAALQPPAA